MSGRGPGLGALVLLAVAVVVLASGGPDDDGRSGDRAAPGGEPPDQGRLRARVVKVVDGDTIEVRVGGGVEDVRYIGIDTPESVAPGQPIECFGERAARFNAELVDGRDATLSFDDERRDRYGRLLAYVRVGRTFVNAELVRRGYARVLSIPPNTDREALFGRLEQTAGNAGRGLWGAC